MAKLPKIGNDLSLSEQAYLVIKDAIINNKLKPREVLSEEALAAELGISRTPVRSALKKLEFERLVGLNPGRNAVVADISSEDMGKVFPIRIALEPLAARFTAAVITQEQLEDLREILEAQEEATKTSDYDLYLQKDYEFHLSLAKYTDNEMLYNFVQSVSSHIQRFLILSLTLQKSSVVALEEHWAVLAAIKNRDPREAEEKMSYHVENVANRILGNGDTKHNTLAGEV